jgi:hypothetical protein
MWWTLLLAMGSGAAEPPEVEVLELDERLQGRPTVLVLRTDTTNMDSFVRGLVGELRGTFNLAALVVGQKSSPELVRRAIDEQQPDAIVILDNPTAELYRAYQQAHPERTDPPAIIAMALFMEQTASRLRNATGISYEVPAVTSLARLRSTIRSPVVKVGVVHRPPFGEFVAAQARLAQIEGFELVPYELPAKPTVAQLRKALIALDKLGVDALWVLNDNTLFSSALLLGGWLPLMRRYEWPAVVGVASLLRTEPPVGSFAVLPDHESLGMQAAELIYELQDAGWTISRAPPQLPIAVETVVNKPLMDRTVGIQPGAIDQIDQIIE